MVLLTTTFVHSHHQAQEHSNNYLTPNHINTFHQYLRTPTINMKAVLISSLAALLALASAAPAAAPAGGSQSPPAQSAISVTLLGATPEAQYTVSIPTTGYFTSTNNALSISHAQTNGGPCGLFGIDGLIQEIDSATYVDVGPPQTIVGVACGPKRGESGW